jgi:hypothetical protein
MRVGEPSAKEKARSRDRDRPPGYYGSAVKGASRFSAAQSPEKPEDSRVYPP